jgi:hypothetical protein
MRGSTRRLLIAAAPLPTLLMAGCLERVIHVTTEPPGALVFINDQEVGRTPLETPFRDFGTYDVRVELEGYEAISVGLDAKAPFWEWPGIDLAAEAMPFPIRTDVRWHFDLQPETTDPEALLERAINMRDRMEVERPEPAEEESPAAPESTDADEAVETNGR